MKIVIFAPHPDDELIGCGGTILKNIEKGNSVEIVFITSGDLSESRVREKEIENIYKNLKIKYHLMREKDRVFQYDKKTLEKFVRILRKIKPDIVYLPHKNEEDRDHKEAHKIIKEASWIACDTFMPKMGKPCNIKKIISYEVWTPIKEPSYYENIDKFIKKKIELLKKYHSQISHQRYDLAAKGLSQYRGIMGRDCLFAEAFKIEEIDKL